MFRKLTLACVAVLGLMGMTAVRTDASPLHHHYQVQYRQLIWQERIFTCPIEANQFERDKLSQGYEVSGVRHGAHIHVRYCLPVWVNYQTVPHRHEAQDLGRMLESRGYQVRIVR